MTQIERPVTLADLLADPELFRIGERTGTRRRAEQAYQNVLWRAAFVDRDGYRQAEPPESGTCVTDPARITLADFVKRVDRWTLLRSRRVGRVLREELERGLEKYGYRLVDDLRVPTPADEGRLPMSRDALLARVSDVLRRAGAPDAATLTAEIERRMPQAEPPAPQRGGQVIATWSERCTVPL